MEGSPPFGNHDNGMANNEEEELQNIDNNADVDENRGDDEERAPEGEDNIGTATVDNVNKEMDKKVHREYVLNIGRMAARRYMKNKNMFPKSIELTAVSDVSLGSYTTRYPKEVRLRREPSLWNFSKPKKTAVPVPERTGGLNPNEIVVLDSNDSDEEWNERENQINPE